MLLLVALFLCCTRVTAQAEDGAPSILQDRVDAAAELLKHDARLGALPDDAARRDALCFIVGNMLFVLLHEIGHVLITELGLPVLGREEDAADAYATVTILAMKTSSPSAFSPMPRKAGSTAIAATGWS